MNLNELMTQISAGGVVSVLVIILSLVEISPVKISPLAWIGKRVNQATLDTVKEMEKKLDDHIAQSYRTKILDAQDSLLRGERFSQEQFSEILDACTAYEDYVEKNVIKNGKVEHAIKYINHKYDKCLDSGDFIDLDQLIAADTK